MTDKKKVTKTKDVRVPSIGALTQAYTILVCARVSIYNSDTKVLERRNIHHRAIFVNMPTADDIINDVENDPLKTNMHCYSEYKTMLRDCLIAFGVPNIDLANGAQASIGNYRIPVIRNVWHASIVNDETSYSAPDAELGFISVSKCSINHN